MYFVEQLYLIQDKYTYKQIKWHYPECFTCSHCYLPMNGGDTQFYDIKLSEFKKIINFLKKNSLNKKVYITFDDGFKSIINATEESINNGFKTSYCRWRFYCTYFK